MAEIKSVDRLREIIADYGPRGSAKIYDHLCEQALAFVCRAPFAMLATHGDYGLEISQKGGNPGFMEVVSDRLLLIPEWTGNHLAIGLQNILRDPHVALAVMLPGTDEILRISGRATLLDDREICQRLSCDGKPATLISSPIAVPEPAGKRELATSIPIKATRAAPSFSASVM